MNKIVTKKDKFEDALAKIERDSKKDKQLPDLDKFQEKDGLFGVFPKIITGKEMNAFSVQLQDNLIKINEKIRSFYKRFFDIYVAFETLDKEYIAGIVGAFNQAIEATKKAEDAQQDINKTVAILEKTVEKIKEFNNKVSYELSIIDSEHWRENALKYQNELKHIDEKSEEIIKTIGEYKEQYQDLKSELEQYKKEKKRNSKIMISVFITTGLFFLTTLVLVFLVVFKVL